MRNVIVFLILASGLVLAGCDSVGNPLTAQKTISAQQKQIDSLQKQVSSVAKDVADVKQEQSKFEMEDFFRGLDNIAYLQPGDSGYSLVHSDLGVLTVQIVNVEPYASGSKVVLRFGNPLATNINGLKVKLDWGSVNSKGIAENDTAKSKEFTFSQSLSSGAWTSIPVVLDGVPPDKLGFVRVSNVRHTGIGLAR